MTFKIIIASAQGFIEWIFRNHKVILVLATFTVFFVGVLKELAVGHVFPDVGQGWLTLLSIQLGIQAAHAAYAKKLGGNGGNVGGTNDVQQGESS